MAFFRPFSIMLATCTAIVAVCCTGCSGTPGALAPGQQQVTATPTLSLASGSYTGAQSLTISDQTAGAVIYYAFDAAPTTASTVYSSTISVPASATIEAVAIAPGMTQSAVATVALAINYPPATSGIWTWMGGSNVPLAIGVYGTQGTAAAANIPGARTSPAAWKDKSGNFWLFGGLGTDANGSQGVMNDLWEYTPTTKQWTWVTGSNTVRAAGVYGTQGAGAAGNTPGARQEPATWTDASGNLWLFGGSQRDFSISGIGYYDFNDLWKFDVTTKQWTWVSGSNTLNSLGTFGTQGVGSASNIPSARLDAMNWVDGSGNFWLFGGSGLDSAGSPDNVAHGVLNDLWEYSPTTGVWTWVSGSKIGGSSGVYGTMGTASAGTMPGARSYGTGWIDGNGNFWVFGGVSMDSAGNQGFGNDLWEYAPSTKQWTWVAGSNLDIESPTGTGAVFGTPGVAAAGNTPGQQVGAAGWVDSSGNLWLFGGFGYAATGANTYVNAEHNDLWKFNPTSKQWAWMGGSNSTANLTGVYGTLGVGSATNNPGAREGSATWVDGSGNLWLFGGVEYATGVITPPTPLPLYNDLWQYQP